MKKILFIHLLFIIGCTNKNYNTPFINVDETITLKFGMTKDDVVDNLNEPYFVAYGDDKTTIWVYEVRTEVIKSKLGSDGLTLIPSKKTIRSKDKKHSPPIHRLSLVFENNQLISWSEYE